ncbi:hypothetical protein BJ138DRAFT_1127732 [Hygrophoropsis aurantiaca]|uniref:Uncharacterized protein n=1 Tax=Hygrophoropsis aurantiaca TaxID=72124 RepID=A0ACB8A838_9AGAM|nr:hypothetical protein BJ138DRAFT_1127732 [Hygrophoropsis aurantiaca]
MSSPSPSDSSESSSSKADTTPSSNRLGKRTTRQEPEIPEPVKKKSKADGIEVVGIKHFRLAARWIPRDINLFCDLDMVLTTAPLVERESLNSWDSPEAEKDGKFVLDELSQSVKDQYREDYNKILSLVPALHSYIGVTKKKDELDVILNRMQGAVGAARGEDLSRLKPCIALYAVFDPIKSAINPPIVAESKGRTRLGINHPYLAQLLCPAKKLAQFLRDPDEARKQMQNGQISLKAVNLPSFMYEGKVPGEHYDPNDIKKGWGRGFLPIRVAQRVFTGPSSVFRSEQGVKGSRAPNAKIHGMKKVKPQHIAYAMVLARISISSADSWHETDGKFSYRSFYFNTIKTITDTPNKIWVADLLAHWNKELFGSESGADGTPLDATHESDDDSDNDMAAMMAQFSEGPAAAPSGSGQQEPDTPDHDELDTPARAKTPFSTPPHKAGPSPAATHIATPRVATTAPSRAVTPSSPRALNPGSNITPPRQTLVPHRLIAGSPLTDEDPEPVVAPKRAKGKAKAKGPSAPTRTTRGRKAKK